MPLLNYEQLQALHKRQPRVCDRCGRAVRPNYCRRCDEFFEAGHLGIPNGTIGCPDAKHDEHRTY